MAEPEFETSLQNRDLFDLFRDQLQRDFENSGLDASFTRNLPHEYTKLKERMVSVVQSLIVSASVYFSGLLYRVDISEKQISVLSTRQPDMNLSEVIAELIIKRTLQKVILRKKFSEGL